MRHTVQPRWLIVGLAASAALLLGCSGASDGAPSSASSPEATAATEEVGTAQAGSQSIEAPTEVPSETPVAATVLVKGFLFQPASIEVPAGTTVTWENSDQILHTATSGGPGAPSGLFDGQMDGADTSFTHSFDTPGTFVFFCSRHPHMRGEVVVR